MAQRKLGFRLEIEDDWPPAAVEWIWCEEIGDRFQIKNVPFFAKGIAFGDLISAQLDDENLIDAWSMVATSGDSTIWIIRVGASDIVERLHVLGCGYETMKQWPNYITLNVPMHLDMKAVLSVIDAAVTDGEIEAVYPALRREE